MNKFSIVKVMSIAVKCFLQLVILLAIANGLSSKGRQRGITLPTTSNDQQSSSETSFSNAPHSSNNNGSRPRWFAEALKDIAYYLRAHKFNEYDRRYELKAENARQEYYIGFPRPPLRSLHWEVHKYCESSFEECVDYLRKRVQSADMKRSDDTAVVIQDQQWNFHNHRNQIYITDEECRASLKVDNMLANPFEGPIERFQWRVTASYYMCLYTMSSTVELQHLSESCDNFADCLDPNLGPNNRDPRANDSLLYSCALYSFCPDPCCPMKHLTDLEKCWHSPDNPCFAANPAERQCFVNRSQNTDFSDIILNRWNVTCSCPEKGYEWNSLYGICVDVDECIMGWHECDPISEICVNLPGRFKCTCRWGHLFQPNTSGCIPSPVLKLIRTIGNEMVEETKQDNLFTRFLNLFAKSSSSKTAFTRFLLVTTLFLICKF